MNDFLSFSSASSGMEPVPGKRLAVAWFLIMICMGVHACMQYWAQKHVTTTGSFCLVCVLRVICANLEGTGARGADSVADGGACVCAIGGICC